MIANQLSDHSALRQIGTDDAVENRNVTLIFNAKSLSVHSSLPKPPFSRDVFWLLKVKRCSLMMKERSRVDEPVSGGCEAAPGEKVSASSKCFECGQS
jgi:hypothetical protein